MISTKTLVKMVRKWQDLVVIRRKRISLPKIDGNVEIENLVVPLVADIGYFVVYSDDGRRFVIPLVYLKNEVWRQLLEMSEEEFGQPGDSPIRLPCHAFLLEYITSLIRRGVAEDVEKALAMSVCRSRYFTSSSLHQGPRKQPLLVY